MMMSFDETNASDDDHVGDTLIASTTKDLLKSNNYKLPVPTITNVSMEEQLDGEILPFLKNKTFLTDAVLYNAVGRYDGSILKELLTESHCLTSLKLGIRNWAAQEDFFTDDLAQGLRQNKSLKCLYLVAGTPTCDYWSQPRSPVDISNIIQTFSHHQHTLEELKLDCEFASKPTLQALATYLQQPKCQLKSLEITCYTDCCNDVKLLIRAVKKSPILKRFDLSLRDPSDPSMEALDRNSTFKLIVEALKKNSTSSNKSNNHFNNSKWNHLSICNHGLEQPLEAKHLDKILQTMEANTQLESVQLQVWYKAGVDGCFDFDRQMKYFCTRNKAIKTAEALQQSTVLPNTLCDLLEDIERDCPNTANCHFVNLWYSLLSSRPHEVERYTVPIQQLRHMELKERVVPNKPPGIQASHIVGGLIAAFLMHQLIGVASGAQRLQMSQMAATAC